MNQESFAYPTIDLLQGKQKHQIDDKKKKKRYSASIRAHKYTGDVGQCYITYLSVC